MTDLITAFIALFLLGGTYALVGYLLAVAGWAVIASWSNKIARPAWRSIRWALGFTAVLLVVVSAAATPAIVAHVASSATVIGVCVLVCGLLVGIIGTIGGASLYRNIG